MDKRKFMTGSTQVNVLLFTAILIILILIGTALGASAMGLLGYGDNAPFFGKSTGTGCFLDEGAFSNASSITSADQAISLIQGETNKKNLVNNKAFLEKIISRSQAKTINPAILIAFWGAEQSFRNPDQAFGCGNHSGSSGASGQDNEITCALDLVTYAMSSCKGGDKCEGVTNSSADWSTPSGENIWTRLLFHYVMGSPIQPEGNLNYKNHNYVSLAESPRIKFLSQLVPEQVKCNTGFSGTIGDAIGPWDTSFMSTHAGLKSWLGKRNNSNYKRTMHGVTLHWTGSSAPKDKPPLGKEGVEKILNYWMGKETPSVTHMLIDSDGTVYQFIPFNVKQSGSGTAYIGEGGSSETESKIGANDFTIGIEIAGVGDELLQNEKQKAKVIEVVQYLVANGYAIAEKGNNLNFTAKRGIFGHYQTGGGGVPGCSSSRKEDPGKAYMEEIWQLIGATGGGC